MTEQFTVTFQDSFYTVTAAQPGCYSLFTSASPDGFTPDAYAGDFTESVTVPPPAPGRRCWFHILDDAANHWVTSLRVLPFSTVENFRELGGYPAADGRFVRWGRFYRAARLTHLNAAETERFAALGIRTILDLRSSGEIAAHPDPVFAGARQKAISAILQMDGNEKDFDPANLLTQSAQEMQTDADEFEDIYREMPFQNKAYQWMFDRLLEEETPVLFHCTAGKDRTGIAAALILLALGTPRSVIEQDYMLTNVCCKDNIDKLVGAYYRPEQPEFVRYYLTCIGGVGLHNLAAALDAIGQRYSSCEEFFAVEYGIDDEKLMRLRKFYTEAPRA